MKATSRTYAGLFLVTMSTLMLELLLTRIFSVTMWYHFAFMAISIAVFGMTAGAIVVYLNPRLFKEDQSQQSLTISASAFALSVVLCAWLQFNIRFIPLASIIGFLTLTAIYIVASIPFFFSGVCVCLALTRFPGQIGKLYAADLIGAAAGCLLVPFVLEWWGGPTAVLSVGAIASMAGLLFASGAERRSLTFAAISAVIALGVVPFNLNSNMIHLAWIKGFPEQDVVYEKWNSFSRIRVVNTPEAIQGVTLAARKIENENKHPLKTIRLDIDSTAATALIPASNPAELKELVHNVCGSVHRLRPKANVAVIGVGGGVDVLTALACGQPHVLGIELNKDILRVLTEKYGDFTGHLDRLPGVKLVNDEARSYLERSDTKFDVITISLIDTWAATSAGAFVLSENSLYTVQAWKAFLNHLQPHGVLSCSRWYYRDHQEETYRLTALAAEALRGVGVGDSLQSHMFLLTNLTADEKGWIPDMATGTLLISKDPFSIDDLHAIENFARDNGLVIVLSPTVCLDQTLKKIIGPDAKEFVADYPLNISAPTDDSPFFFQTTKLVNWMSPQLAQKGAGAYANMIAISTLMALLVIVGVLTLACIIVPLALTAKKFDVKSSLPYLVYFAAIGMGYMFIEISQMQRLAIFLGHPTYGLFVVLFTFLFASGTGSYISHVGKSQNQPRAWLTALVVAVAAFGMITPAILENSGAASIELRIAISVGILFPIGLLMGTAFPIGMEKASTKLSSLTPWFWGINGATTVCASVLSIVIAIGFGISAAYWVGVLFYAIAVSALLLEITRTAVSRQ